MTVADGGQSGIDTLVDVQARGERPDAVITDLGMPHLDGRAVAAAVKALDPGTAVILLTGWGARLVADNEVLRMSTACSVSGRDWRSCARRWQR